MNPSPMYNWGRLNIKGFLIPGNTVLLYSFIILLYSDVSGLTVIHSLLPTTKSKFLIQFHFLIYFYTWHYNTASLFIHCVIHTTRRNRLPTPSNHPAGTWCNNNVFITYKRRRRRRFDAMKTLSLRHYCVICPLAVSCCARVNNFPRDASYIKSVFKGTFNWFPQNSTYKI